MDANTYYLNNFLNNLDKSETKEQKAYTLAQESFKKLEFVHLLESVDDEEVQEHHLNEFNRAWSTQNPELIGLVVIRMLSTYMMDHLVTAELEGLDDE